MAISMGRNVTRSITEAVHPEMFELQPSRHLINIRVKNSVFRRLVFRVEWGLDRNINRQVKDQIMRSIFGKLDQEFPMSWHDDWKIRYRRLAS